jgi:hypothetical protein
LVAGSGGRPGTISVRSGMKPLVFLIGLLVLACMTEGCGESDGESVPTHIVYGRLTSTSANPGGKDGLVKVVGPSEGAEDEALYFASCGFTGPSCEYQIHWVLEGSYTVFAFIDMNGNAVYDFPVPDSGDLITRGRALILWETTQIDFNDDAWHEMP